MKKQTKKRSDRTVRTFATEAEWWYKNRNVRGNDLLAAVRPAKRRC